MRTGLICTLMGSLSLILDGLLNVALMKRLSVRESSVMRHSENNPNKSFCVKVCFACWVFVSSFLLLKEMENFLTGGWNGSTNNLEGVVPFKRWTSCENLNRCIFCCSTQSEKQFYWNTKSDARDHSMFFMTPSFQSWTIHP